MQYCLQKGSDVVDNMQEDDDHELLDHALGHMSEVMTQRCRMTEDFVEGSAMRAVEEEDITLGTVQCVVRVLPIPSSSRRKNVIPRG